MEKKSSAEKGRPERHHPGSPVLLLFPQQSVHGRAWLVAVGARSARFHCSNARSARLSPLHKP